MIAQATSTQLEQARTLLGAGYSIIPIAENKKPAIPWKRYQREAMPEDEAPRHWGRQDQSGIGLVCGAVSGNLEVIDFDIRNRTDLAAFWESFRDNVVVTAGVDAFDNVAVILTPGPGLQVVYRCSEPVGGNQKLARHNGTIDPETGNLHFFGFCIINFRPYPLKEHSAA